MSAVFGRGGERRALCANAAVEECEEERPEGNVAVHRAGSQSPEMKLYDYAH